MRAGERRACAGVSHTKRRAELHGTPRGGVVPSRSEKSGAHQGYSVRNEHFDLGGLSPDGAQPHFTPHGKRRCPLEHWVDVRGDSFGILWSVCGRLVRHLLL